MTHTPTPWRVTKAYRITGGPQGHTYVASLDNVKHLSPEELEANAAFIVRAVNSHDEMLAALKGVCIDLRAAGRGEAFIRIANLIAKVEGRGP
jgi:hypothetical protein